MTTHLDEYKDDFILLLEAGFIAVNQSDEDATLKLFKAAQLLKPESTLPKIGEGYLHLHKLELSKAIKCFEEVIKKEPKNDMAKALLGIAMTMTTDQVSKGEKLLVETQKSHDKSIQSVSETAINFVDKFVKKSPTPVEGHKKHK
jgi:hypothetical protein